MRVKLTRFLDIEYVFNTEVSADIHLRAIPLLIRYQAHPLPIFNPTIPTGFS